METVEWESIKDFYKEHFGIDAWVVEMLANLDILLLCASGASNETISIFLEIPRGEIDLVIKEVFNFPGWELDLPLNPLKIFQSCINYIEFDIVVDPILTTYLIEIDTQWLYNLCSAYKNIEERIQDEWI